jgi:hypothetical protein
MARVGEFPPLDQLISGASALLLQSSTRPGELPLVTLDPGGEQDDC